MYYETRSWLTMLYVDLCIVIEDNLRSNIYHQSKTKHTWMWMTRFIVMI